MKGAIGATTIVMVIAGLALLPWAAAGTATGTRNAYDGIYVGTVTAVSTTGGIMGAPAPNGVSHQGFGEAGLSCGFDSRQYKTPIIQLQGSGQLSWMSSDIGIIVKGAEQYQPDGDLQFAYTRVWVWGVSFDGGWYYLGPNSDCVSSTCDAGSGIGFQ
jgi:hypothetical protein